MVSISFKTSRQTSRHLVGGKPLRRDDTLTAKVYRLLISGYTARTVSVYLKKSRPSIYDHIKKLLDDGAIIKENGHWKPGRNGIKYQAEHPDTSAQRGAATSRHPDIETWRLENVRFRIDLPVGCRMPVKQIINNGTRIWDKEYKLRDGLRCHIKTWNDKTAVASFQKFHVNARLIPYLNQYLMSIGFEAMWAFARDTNIRFPIDHKPSPIADPKAKLAEMPLITGEMCRPLPTRNYVRIQSGPTEINNSPPGPSLETADILEGYVDAFASQRIIGLEKGVTAILSMLERHEKAFLSYAEAVNRQAEAFGKMTESLSQLLNPPPRDTSERLEGYR